MVARSRVHLVVCTRDRVVNDEVEAFSFPSQRGRIEKSLFQIGANGGEIVVLHQPRLRPSSCGIGLFYRDIWRDASLIISY